MLQHHHAIGDIGDDAEIVSDEHHRHVAATLQVSDQLQDLRLRRDVQRRRRFVGDQHGRLQRQRHGDHHALALAAGQLMRIGAHRTLGIRQADLAQQLERFLLSLPRRQEIMRLEHLGDLVADPHHRVQRRHRLLKHHGDVAAAQRQPRVLVEREQVLPLEDDLAGLGFTFSGSRPISAWAHIDFPEPDSPTTQRILPAVRSNDTSSTA